MADSEQGRLPPGQRAVVELPILHVGAVPRVDPASWEFRVSGLVENPLRLSWDQFCQLPSITMVADFHCVTGWSRLDCQWRGVAFKTIAALARPLPQVGHVLIRSQGGYSTNLKFVDLMDDDAMFAFELDGRPLEPAYGGPLRLVVPKRYAYKSAKWVRALEFLEQEVLGYWESRGYSNTADPWTENRFSGKE